MTDHEKTARELLTKHQLFGEMHSQARCTSALLPAIAAALEATETAARRAGRIEGMREANKLVATRLLAIAGDDIAFDYKRKGLTDFGMALANLIAAEEAAQ